MVVYSYSFVKAQVALGSVLHTHLFNHIPGLVTLPEVSQLKQGSTPPRQRLASAAIKVQT